MLREFQAEIARLKAQLAERQQQRAASAGLGSPEKAAALGAAAAAGSGSGSAGTMAAEARAAAIRQAMRAELQRSMRQAASVEALAKARQAIEAQARWGWGVAVGVARRRKGVCVMPRLHAYICDWFPCWGCEHVSFAAILCNCPCAGSGWRLSWPAAAAARRSGSTSQRCWRRSRQSCRWGGVLSSPTGRC